MPYVSRKTGKSLANNQPQADLSSDDESISPPSSKSQLPAPGDKIAINCPADPPHPAGWYSAIVVSATNDSNGYTLDVEWDGGDLETLQSPEWRHLGEEPDQKGITSAKDGRLRPHLSHVVRRLLCADRAEGRLPMSTRRQKKSSRNLEWVQCASASCGKFRSLPPFLTGPALLRSCNNTFFCVLNYWDESLASCAAPQETRLMEVQEQYGYSRPQQQKVQGKRSAQQGDGGGDFEYGYRPKKTRR